jgi:enoyl-CoA hydratase/carnithine racemase
MVPPSAARRSVMPCSPLPIGVVTGWKPWPSSAGPDLDEHFRLFAGNPAAVGRWFAGYRATNIPLFTYPRPTVAAINGHAFAGGLITAPVCDHRIAVTGEASLGLNEVPIGIPMPAVYVRKLAYAWGEPAAARASLLGEIFTPAQAHTLGRVRELVPAEDLPDRAVTSAAASSSRAARRSGELAFRRNPHDQLGRLRLHRARSALTQVIVMAQVP